MGAAMRAHDWSASPLGDPSTWPQPLRSAVGLILDSRFPMFVAWGTDLGFLYNDAYASILGDKHPAALGARFHDIWSEIWPEISPLIDAAMAGVATWQEDLPLTMNRHGFDERTWFTFSYSPARDEQGAVAGMFCACTETTGQVLAEAALRESEARANGVLEGMAEGFVLVDREFRVLAINAEALKLELRARDEIIGRTHWEVWPETRESELGRLYRRAMSERVPVSLEHRYVWPNGRQAWLEMRCYPSGDGLAMFYRDISDRKISEDNQQFHFDLGERLRRLTNPVAVTSTAAEYLGRHLRVARVGYGEIDEAQEMVAVARDWTQAAMPSLAGKARLLDGFGPVLVSDLKAGRTLVVEDFRGDPRAGDAYAEAWTAIGTRAFIVVPLVRGGRLRAIFYLHEPQPRAWSQEDVELARTAAERTWEAVERASAEAALLASEAQFEAIANSIDQMVWSTRPDGFHDYYNQRWYDYTGVPEDSTDGEAWNGMFHPDDQERAWACWRNSLATGEPYQIEYRLRHRSGEYRWVTGRAQPVCDEYGSITRWYGTCTDIHELKCAEQALRESRDQLAAESQALEILNATGTQVAADLGLKSLVQRVVDAGVALTGARFGAFFYNVLDEAGARYMLYALAGAERSQFDDFGMPRATSVFAPTFHGEGVVRSADILADTRYGKNTPHKGMPEGHLPVRSYLAVPVVSRNGEVIGGLFFGHDETGVFTERAERVMTGLAAQAAIAIDNARLFDDVQRANAELEDRVRSRTAELEQAHEALRQSQKMEAVGQLTGGIAHDFNNMLAVVIGSLDLLGRRLGTADARARRYVDAATDGARRAALLTQRLLAFSRQQPLRPEAIDVGKLVTGMSDLIRGSLGSDIRFETVLAGGGWRAHADPNQLENVLLNLAVNARDAMPEGGRLTVETQNAHLDARYAAAHLGVPPGQYVLIAVTDTGSGMPEAVIARAFDPFFTTKEVGKGTGLGLSQVYGFVKQSGGHVKIYSEPGQGTTVKVYLPRLLNAAEDAPEEASAPGLPTGDAQEIILIVEDEPAVRQFSVDALGELGYRVLEADGAATALRLLDLHPEITLMFTDVVMPDINGRRLADEARARRPDLKVLFTTGYTRNAVVHNGVLDSGVELIGKPFTVEELAAKVRDLLDAPTVPPQAAR